MSNINSRRDLLKAAAGIAVGTLVFPQVSLAAKDAIYTSRFSNKAVGGYDTVAYFTKGKPVEGKRAFSTTYKDATWQFASQENLDLFLGNPEQYAPAYGGYCAYAVALGTTVKGDPKHWEVYNDRLYLNVNRKIKKKWSASKESYLVRSEANWPTLLA